MCLYVNYACAYEYYGGQNREYQFLWCLSDNHLSNMNTEDPNLGSLEEQYLSYLSLKLL